MSCCVVPSRHVVLVVLIRGLRPRLPSLRSVVPSRHSPSTKYYCPRIAQIGTNGCNGLKWRPGRSHELSLMQGGGGYDDNGDNLRQLKLSLAGATEMPQNIIAHELHECNEGTGVLQNAPTQHLTPESINASVFYDDNGDNLRQLVVVFCGCNRNNQRKIFAHELHECNEGTGVLQNAPTQHLTPESINASVFCDDNWNNLRQLEVVFCGCNRERIFLPTNCTD